MLANVAKQTYWVPGFEELRLFSTDLTLVATIVGMLIFSMILGRRAGLCAMIALIGTVVAFFCNWNVWELLEQSGAVEAMAPQGKSAMLLADNFTVFFKFILLIFLFSVTVLWLLGPSSDERDAPEFFVLLVGSALGMSLMVSTLNLLMIIIAIELASLPSYAIVAFDKRSRQGAEGSLKYVIYGSASAGIMLYGASLLYGMFGTLDLSTLAVGVLQALESGSNILLLSIALLAFLTGIGFKISAVPFHFWCPDVFQGAKIEVTTWLSVVSKAAGLCLLLRIMQTLANAATAKEFGANAAYVDLVPLTVAIGMFAAATCFVGNLAAYRQQSVKRMLAYSSIAHAGYMLMLAAIILQPQVAEYAWTALAAYVVMYLFMNLGAFGAIAMVVWHSGDDHISNFNGLGRRAPLLALGLTLCLFSLVGMPPLGGFIAKWWLLVALAESAQVAGYGSWLWGLIIWASLNTAFSLFYYVRVIKHMYLENDDRGPLNAPLGGVAMVNACAVILILCGTFWANPIKTKAGGYAKDLFVGAPITEPVQTAELESDQHAFADH